MVTAITASLLYDLVSCEHRPWMDLHADPALRDPVSPFMEMLWRRGRAYEQAVTADGELEALDLSVVPREERAAHTLEAMRAGMPLIYAGRLEVDDLCGEPDLLRLTMPGRYVPGDIKSGSADEGPSDGDRKPKKAYAVQLALYVDALERLGFGAGRHGFIWDVRGREVTYDLTAPKGVRTPSSLWDDYRAALDVARATIAGEQRTEPAYTGECKMCVWRTACLRTLEERRDLTLIPELGRSIRETLQMHVPTMTALATSQPERFIDGKNKSIVPRVGPESIRKFHARAVLITTAGKPYLTQPVHFPNRATELFFDVETDPGRDLCYLHGFVERRNGAERFVPFFAAGTSAAQERAAFAAAWTYVQSRRPCAIYVFSPYEQTWWKALQQRYPDVCSAADVAALFADPDTIDLYKIVRDATEWPTHDRTVKTLARYLGFAWRDADPSGAASIEWYDRFVSGDIEAQQRILEYNEDDCRATRVLLDGIRALRVAA
jgi:uncharacterized protein